MSKAYEILYEKEKGGPELHVNVGAPNRKEAIKEFKAVTGLKANAVLSCCLSESYKQYCKMREIK